MGKFLTSWLVTQALCTIVSAVVMLYLPSIQGYIKPHQFFMLMNACLAQQFANEKGYRGWVWFLNGLFFGPLGSLVACYLPDRLTHKRLKDIEDL